MAANADLHREKVNHVKHNGKVEGTEVLDAGWKDKPKTKGKTRAGIPAAEPSAAPEGAKQQHLTIQPPNFQEATFRISGTTPYVQNKFSAKARQKMREAQEAGPTAKKGAKKDPKDFQASFRDATHRFPDGGYGIPAPAFRNACIDACRMCGFAMTRAKMSIFIDADGFDVDDGTPLVRLGSEPEYLESTVRNQSGVCDIRPRPMWKAGWSIMLRVRFDADQFTLDDVSNLLLRAGLQVGVGEGRPFSKESAGIGWGQFTILGEGKP